MDEEFFHKEHSVRVGRGYPETVVVVPLPKRYFSSHGITYIIPFRQTGEPTLQLRNVVVSISSTTDLETSLGGEVT